GLTGTLLFAAFLYSLVRASGRHSSGDREMHAIGNAAVMASIAQVASVAISGSGTDLGLLFSTTAGQSDIGKQCSDEARCSNRAE
ncbi:hypothetical protein ACCT16_37275, partial [Rhizobium ruizarguesonis]